MGVAPRSFLDIYRQNLRLIGFFVCSTCGRQRMGVVPGSFLDIYCQNLRPIGFFCLLNQHRIDELRALCLGKLDIGNITSFGGFVPGGSKFFRGDVEVG